ncbi:TetR family transcriptional regulator [Rouxiella silvae]|uniref:TetR family transcriptional regulator n=1 Tax=Rouxiella silvae TaxID=1646373 RepID=A0AA41BXB3_9GAMM|nr:TetR/AcrR family transcriptional regulator [Rouxiella silvae]MBF6638011.1 TetR/AcrR family transcriptional regulator [Rouxiella silvae]ORJ20102.1 TetR family transcriptional regulator [Rouxiella silvae]
MRTLSEERRKSIIDTATALFQEMGYERTSMNEVAKRMGGSKATLYNYFASKEELFEKVVRTYSTQLLAAAASELSTYSDHTTTLEQKLQRFGERMLEILVTDDKAIKIYRCVIGEAGHSNIGELFLASGTQESMDKLAELMWVAMENGELAAGDAVLRATQFTSLMRAEVDIVLYQRVPVLFKPDQITLMVKRGVQIFLYGASAIKMQKDP